jgi:hypothetical protein
MAEIRPIRPIRPKPWLARDASGSAIGNSMPDEPDGPLAALGLATERPSSRGSSDAPPRPILRLTAADAELFDEHAAFKRGAVENCGDPVLRAQFEAEAEGLEALAARLRDPAAHGIPTLRQGQGAETAPPANPAMLRRYSDVAKAVGASPGMLAADASLARLGLARDGGVLTLAVETAQDAGAETAAQKMLAHQLAAAHPLAMELLAIASAEAHKHRTASHLNNGALAEAARTTTAAARLMDSFARGALILDRLLNGARQTVMVQHVTVGDGGQAVVAGNVAPRDRVSATPRPSRGRKSK